MQIKERDEFVQASFSGFVLGESYFFHDDERVDSHIEQKAQNARRHRIPTAVHKGVSPGT